MTARNRAAGLGASLLILAMVVGTPLLLLAIGVTPWTEDPADLGTLLTSPDDGTLALLVIGVVAWVAWAVLALTLLVEILAAIRGITPPRLPGLALPQGLAARLVATAALLFAVAPVSAPVFTPQSAHAAPVVEFEATPIASLPEASLAPSAAPTAVTQEETPTVEYVVRRGDSLWKIAQDHLGDGMRYREIVALNESVLHGEPSFIDPGLTLRLPSDAAPATDATDEPHSEGTHVVEPGDTLWDVAEAELGDGRRYPEIFEASQDTVQADGQRLTDPDLIRPGWELTIPGHARPKADEQPTEVAPPSDRESQTQTTTPDATPSTAEPKPEVVTAPADDGPEAESATPGWLLPGLTGGGAVLAAVALLAIRAHRNTQLRYRRPGQTVASPPPELRAVEKTAFVSGGPLTKTIETLDRALMQLAGDCSDSGRALPSVVSATLAKGTVALHLADEADLPAPWAGAGREWSLELTEALPERGDMLPPYPLLVTIGQDDHGLHLVNLEQLGAVALTGAPERAKALARHIAAELALNPWSTIVEVNVIGLGEELAPLDSLRLRHHANGEEVVPSFVNDLTTSLEHGWGDPEPFRAVITTDDGTTDLAPLLASPSSRLGTALVSLAAPLPESTVFEVDQFGRLRAPTLGLDLHAAGLTSEEAKACAAIVDLTRESEPVKVPPFEQAADGWRALADQAGALREELTHVRVEGPAGEGSLLPESAQEYIGAAATTVEDVETLAPIAPRQVLRTVEEADPTLNEDVADWFNPDSKRPRLVLDGAVNARAFGELAPAITKRKPYFVEMLAYLVLHPKGATGSAVADAFAVAPSRARTDLGILRDWLGMNPRTGQEYLPQAYRSPAFKETGVRTYQVQDVLCDIDLFRRLRTRAQARGAEGIGDLKLALSLVDGVPFSNLRDRGWSWLLDTERLHETIGHAIVDTAHIVVVDAMAKGDLATAREAAETACTAAPHDDICRLDLVKVASAEGHGEAAHQMLSDNVFNRTDDYLPPIDLPPRTGDVVDKEGWGDNGRRPSS